MAFIGFILAAIGAAIAPASISAARSLLDEIASRTSDNTTPEGARIAVGVSLGVIVALAALLAIVGLWMLANGVGDLVRRRRVVEGRILRLRTRGDEKKRYWHMAVDDGSSAKVRAWRLSTSPPMGQGATVTARVSRTLCHVKQLERVDQHEPLTAQTTPEATVQRDVDTIAAPPPPLPDTATVSAALGRQVWIDPHAPRHPLALGGASVTFAADDGARVIAAWVAPDVLSAYRSLPNALASPVSGVGDEAYRAPLGGGLVARAGDHVLLLAPHLPGANNDERDRVAGALARDTLSVVDRVD